jgi:hypothetical protein
MASQPAGLFQSGVPFTVLDTATPVPSNVSNLVTADRPNVVGGVSYVPANQSYTNWTNVNAFTRNRMVQSAAKCVPN